MQPTLKDWGVTLHLLRWEYLHKLFVVLLHRFVSFSLSMNLIICLYQFGLIDSYFILCCIICNPNTMHNAQYYFNYFVAQVFLAVATGSLSIGFCVSLTCLHQCGVYAHVCVCVCV